MLVRSRGCGSSTAAGGNVPLTVHLNGAEVRFRGCVSGDSISVSLSGPIVDSSKLVILPSLFCAPIDSASARKVAPLFGKRGRRR